VQDMGRLRAAAAFAARRSPEDDPVYRRKARVEAIIERVAKADHDEEEVDRLVREAGERLDDEDLYGEVLGRPVGELVSLICRDLGLAPDWSRLAEEAWARREAAEGDPRSPFAPLPLDGGEVGSRGDGPAAVRPAGHPYRQPFPHQGGREIAGDFTSSLIFDSC